MSDFMLVGGPARGGKMAEAAIAMHAKMTERQDAALWATVAHIGLTDLDIVMDSTQRERVVLVQRVRPQNVALHLEIR